MEWKESEHGTLEAADQLETDAVLPVLNLFYNIWGVGAKTARDFYYHKQWRSLDDVIEQGWDSLSRVQQIGVKYYDEFLDGIPRADVEKIGNVIAEHAKKVRPGCDYDGKGMECVIVGGYRRGKERSGDVDVVLSHRDERVTLNLVYDIVASLEEEGWITHTLALHLTNTNRDQQTLPYRGETGGKPRFDSLDKALVVWQDPYFEDPPSPSADGSPLHATSDKETADEKDLPGLKRAKADGDGPGTGNSTPPEPARKKNPNPHRRVDIIISPWRTVGCAILGWSGDTTFQRDVRRYAKKVHGWKFDSSGVRDRKTGRVIDLEDSGQTWEEREKLVLDGIGVGWRPPEERCTR
jgi:DNA polymerase IV